jgi:hypothetical protein
MPEIIREVRQVEVDYLCDGCGKATMRPTGLTLTSHPPKYPHKCVACGAEQNFAQQFPHHAFVTAKDAEWMLTEKKHDA